MAKGYKIQNKSRKYIQIAKDEGSPGLGFCGGQFIGYHRIGIHRLATVAYAHPYFRYRAAITH
jgi:hypothetical protein